jgi:hypothetical protein
MSVFRVPADVWRLIFEEATFVPYALRPDSSCDHHDQDQIRERLLVVLPTKRNIIHVCRAWYEVAIPLLYQSVFLTPRTVHMMYRLLAPDRLGRGEYGRWVIRLDYERPEGEIPLFNLFSVLRLQQMPNLQILVSRYTSTVPGFCLRTISPTLEDDPEFCFILLSACWRTLKVLDCNHTIFKTRPTVHERFGLLGDREWQKKRFALNEVGPEVQVEKVRLRCLRGHFSGNEVVACTSAPKRVLLECLLNSNGSRLPTKLIG